MKVENVEMKGSWKEVLNDCRFTVGKPSLDKEPSDKFKEDMMIAEHSPIRDIEWKFDIKDLGACYITHLVRHMWTPFVKTQRTDRTGVDRHKIPQDEPNDMRGSANNQHLIDTSRKRLCYKASKETRESWEQLKLKIHELDKFTADGMVPNCVYRCGCPEGDNCCGMYEKWLPFTKVDLTIIKTRYRIYNDWFYRNHEVK